jgi:3-phosphoshikimate 1-carboxyvinyltransferase
MANITVRRLKRLNAELRMPGDKSISHRAMILAGLASGTSTVSGLLASGDCLQTLQAMQALGVETEMLDAGTFRITGRRGKLLPSGEPIDCGNSGTTMRLLAGILAGQPFASRLIGDASLIRRPMKRIAEPLAQMGGMVTCEGPDMTAPLRIQGAALKGIDYTLPVASAQLKSCLLLAGLNAEGKTVLEEPEATRDHTERLLAHFHASFLKSGSKLSVHGGHELHANDLVVPGDFSSAAFWVVAAAASDNGRLIVPGVGLNPTRTAFLSVLTRMGAKVFESVESSGPEPMGTLRVQEGAALKGTVISGKEIPNLIDELPILAVACALAQGTSEIRDAAELRVKESDRIAALATNLRAFGVTVEEKPDGMIIEGGAILKGASVDSFGDHRIAMASVILGLFAHGQTRVFNTDCIGISYPTFEHDLARAVSGRRSGLQQATTST